MALSPSMSGRIPPRHGRRVSDRARRDKRRAGAASVAGFLVFLAVTADHLVGSDYQTVGLGHARAQVLVAPRHLVGVALQALGAVFLGLRFADDPGGQLVERGDRMAAILAFYLLVCRLGKNESVAAAFHANKVRKSPLHRQAAPLPSGQGTQTNTAMKKSRARKSSGSGAAIVKDRHRATPVGEQPLAFGLPLRL